MNRLPICNSQNSSMFRMAFVARSLQGRWWGFISRNYAVWPIFFLMNVFISLKGTKFWFVFVYPCKLDKLGLNNICLVIEIIHIQKYTLSCKAGSDSKRCAYMKVISWQLDILYQTGHPPSMISLCCLHEHDLHVGPWLSLDSDDSDDSDQTGCTCHFVGGVMLSSNYSHFWMQVYTPSPAS